MHKTGTTTLQRMMSNNTTAFEALGYRTFINTIQMNIKNPACYNTDFIRALLVSAENDGMEAVIVSAEMISTFTQQQFLAFVALFSGYEVHLVCTFRHWVHYWPSRWTQNCVRRDSQSFPAYKRKLMSPGQQHPDVRYDLVIEKMKRASPASIRVISYDNAQAQDNLIPTLFDAMDVPRPSSALLAMPQKRANQRRPIETVDLARLFNGLRSDVLSVSQNAMFDSQVEGIPAGERYDMFGAVLQYLRENRPLRDQLLVLLDQYGQHYNFTSDDEEFAALNQRVENTVEGLVFNPSASRLFGHLATAQLQCSELEYADLPPAIQEEMRPMLQANEQKNGS